MRDRVKDRVRRIMASRKRARDCDKTLILSYLERYSRAKSLPETAWRALREALIIDLPSFETMTRRRREIQSEGEMRASKSAQEKRTKAQRKEAERYRR